MRALLGLGGLFFISLFVVGCDGESTPTDGSMPPRDGGGDLDGGGAGDGGGDPDGGGGADAGDAGGGGDGGVAVCGDRVITAPEECDDGNTAAGDGCDDTCRVETSMTCGDGNLDRGAGEQCDDGNTADGDGCSARCLIEAPPSCGDGMLDLADGEECDDGNTAPGDGCDGSCQLEPIGAFCGDGMLDAGEVCDDGNTTNGDGCNPTCNLTGTVTTFVGMPGVGGRVDGVGAAARLRGAGTVATDATHLWLAESGDRSTPGALRRIEIATGDVVTVATLAGPAAEGIATDGAGRVWVAGNDGVGPAIYEFDTTGAPPFAGTRVAGSAPCGNRGCYADGALGAHTFGGVRGLTWYRGSLWIVDPAAGTIRTLDPAAGTVLTVAGGPFQNMIVDGAGSAARFESPRYVVSDNSGTLYISETNGNVIRALNATTTAVTTFAGVAGMAGHVDGVGAAARIHRPRGITADGASLYFVEFNRHTVRQGVFSTAEISTLAGPAAGTMTGSHMDGVGNAAQFNLPFSVAYHFPSRSLFVVDGGNNVIRRIQ